MRNSSKFALAIGLAALAMPAAAQNYGGAQKKKPEQVAKPATVTLPSGRTVKLSPKAGAAIVELQTAVNAKDAAAIPGKLAAAQQAASSNDEKYLVAILQTQAALNANDLSAASTAIVALDASGVATSDEVVGRWAEVGKRHSTAKQHDLAATALERAIAKNPNHLPSLKMLALTREAQGRKGDAVAVMQKTFAAQKAAGQATPESEFKYAAGIAHENKLPIASAVSRDWLAAYPTPKNWHDALRIHRDVAGPKGQALLDNYRLAAVTGGLTTEPEYHLFARQLLAAGHRNEAKAVLDAGAAAKVITLSSPVFKEFTPEFAKVKSRATIDASAKTAMAGASAKAAMDAGDAYYGIGAFAEAAAAYKAAAGKTGADANQANLRAGMALARAGDKAGATASLSSVAGPQSEIAKYWLVWVNTRA